MGNYYDSMALRHAVTDSLFRRAKEVSSVSECPMFDRNLASIAYAFSNLAAKSPFRALLAERVLRRCNEWQILELQRSNILPYEFRDEVLRKRKECWEEFVDSDQYRNAPPSDISEMFAEHLMWECECCTNVCEYHGHGRVDPITGQNTEWETTCGLGSEAQTWSSHFRQPPTVAPFRRDTILSLEGLSRCFEFLAGCFYPRTNDS